jgi:hypothetical protein
LLGVTFGGGAPVLPQPREFAAVGATIKSLEKGQGIAPLIAALAPDGEEKPTHGLAAAFGELFLKGKDQAALAAVLRGFRGLEVTAAELKANRVPVQWRPEILDSYDAVVDASHESAPQITAHGVITGMSPSECSFVRSTRGTGRSAKDRAIDTSFVGTAGPP